MGSCCKRIFCAAFFALLTVFLCSCNQEKGKSVEKIKLGVTVYRKDDTYISSLCTCLENYSKAKETESGKKIIVNIADGQSSQVTQNEQVNRYIARNYSALCVNIVDRTAAATIIAKAKKADVPVIFFNREPVEEDVRMWNKTYYVGANAAQSGTMQGEIVYEQYQKDPSSVDRNQDGKIQYVMLEGGQGHQDALLRTEYSIQYLIKSGLAVEKLANDTANWQRAQGAAKMAKWIEKFGDQIEVVFSNNDDMALGAIDALKEAKLKEMPVIVGVDGTRQGREAVKNGTMLGTAYNDAEHQAEAIFNLAYALACGEEIPKTVELQDGHYVYIPYQIITKQNVEQYN